jgi:hypothetical protein
MSDLVPADDSVPSLGRLVEALTADRASVASLARILTGVLADALPVGLVEIDYERSMSDRLKGREGEPVAVKVMLGDRVLSMYQHHGRVKAEIARSVRGVILSRNEVSITDWITALAEEVRALAEQDAAARAALQRLLLG